MAILPTTCLCVSISYACCQQWTKHTCFNVKEISNKMYKHFWGMICSSLRMRDVFSHPFKIKDTLT